MLRIKKRDGGIEDFDITKIENAIENAFMAEHKFYNHDIIEMLALRVTAEFNKKIVNEVIGVEDIQDSVEIVLIQAGYIDVAKSYIVYRKQHQNLREIKETNLNYKNSFSKRKNQKTIHCLILWFFLFFLFLVIRYYICTRFMGCVTIL